MDRKHAELLQRIEEFAIDADGVKLTFADRLARENSCSRPFAHRVVEEYKRFVFMATVAGHEVTPSDEVDEAWHLHLTYTRSYWDTFCSQVLRHPLHHSPTKGGAVEARRYYDQYERTLKVYEQLFHEPPPCDIWPPADVRFGNQGRRIRVNLARHWIVN